MIISIRTKLLLGFLLIALASIPIVFFAVKGMLNVTSSFSTLVNSRPRVLALCEMKNYANRMTCYTLDIEGVVQITNKEYDQKKQDLLSFMSELDKWQEQYAAHSVISPQNKVPLNIDRLNLLKDNVIVTAFDLILAIETKESIEEIIQKKKNFIAIVSELENYIDSSLHAEKKLFEVEKNQALNTKNRMIRGSLLISLLSFILAIAISMILANQISKPIIELKDIASEISKGGLSKRAPVHSNDEIGQLAISLNRMLESIFIYNKNLENLAENLGDREAKNRAILSAAADGIFVTNQEGSIDTCNIAAESMFQFSSDELIGKNISSLIINKNAHTNEFIKGIIIKEITECTGIKKNLTEFPLEITLSKENISQGDILIWILRDISERKLAEEKLKSLNQQVVMAARQAGMAEVATNILHNVGNVLNGINVAATLMNEKITHSELVNLPKAADLLEKHSRDFIQFLSTDPQGKNFPEFIKALADQWKKEQSSLVKELEALINKIQHVKTIINMQQEISKTIGTIEEALPSDLLEDALTINAAGFEKLGVIITRVYQTLHPILVDKIKVLQILVNLIQNANQSMGESKNKEKILTLKIINKENNFIQIHVIDNGKGILEENLTKIFSYGFTTKKDGHGFGLHSSALLAQEMGGSLIALSNGRDQGATFILELPTKPKRRKEDIDYE